MCRQISQTSSDLGTDWDGDPHPPPRRQSRGRQEGDRKRGRPGCEGEEGAQKEPGATRGRQKQGGEPGRRRGTRSEGGGGSEGAAAGPAGGGSPVYPILGLKKFDFSFLSVLMVPECSKSAYG